MTYRLSATEQALRDCQLVPGIACYEEVRATIWRSRRVGLIPLMVEKHGDIETPKWMIMDVIFEKGVPYYWLVAFNEKDGRDEVTSFASAAAGDWPTCFILSLVPVPPVTRIAHPDDVQERIRGVSDLNYSSTGQARISRKRWTAITKRSNPQIYDALPLGKPYRAIDIGAIVPIFRTETKILGLAIK